MAAVLLAFAKYLDIILIPVTLYASAFSMLL